MCGIFACLHGQSGERGACLKEAVLNRLQRRGPDCLHEVHIPIAEGGLQLHLLGTLLCMRGDPTPLPLGNERGDWLLWNGNAFGGSIQIDHRENDTVKVVDKLGSARTHVEILNVLSTVHGPWSFVFWQASTRSLWFGRDVFGRRSLLWHLPQDAVGDDCLAISSVGHHDSTATPGYWLEVPAVGLFQLICKENMSMESCCTFQSEEGIAHELGSLETYLTISSVRETSPQVFFPPLNKSVEEQSLLHSVHSPITNTSAATVQSEASGATRTETSLPEHTDEATTQNAEKVELLTPSHSTETASTTYDDYVTRLLDVLQSAVQCRVSRAPPVIPRQMVKHLHKTPVLDSTAQGGKEIDVQNTSGIENKTCCAQRGFEGGASCGTVMCGSARVAILFSGGVDSAVLAALADRCVDPAEDIDLINVAFEQRHLPDGDSTRFDVPDRLSGFACLQELNPKRTWNFIMVNVTLDEVNEMRREHISQLVYPLHTVLDDSIGCALWFAARGEGVLYSADHTKYCSYRSSARTLLVGIGADEQMAGYARHRTKFRSSGLPGVIEEVEMDIKRLAKRNLGRDDRCTADNQRDAQYPFLDEQVVAYLQALPMSVKADLSQPRGVGEKRLLRDVATSLHCHAAAALPKRAIQFGSRMAKLAGSSNNRERGSDACDRLFS